MRITKRQLKRIILEVLDEKNLQVYHSLGDAASSLNEVYGSVTPAQLDTFVQDIIGYAYDGEGVEDPGYFAQDTDAIEDAAEEGGWDDEEVLDYFLELSVRERLALIKRAM